MKEATGEGALTTPSGTRTVPRHRSIAQVLREDIRLGRYEVGARLPTEERLCEMFGASRNTLREALRALTDEGLIVRRPRAGSLVVATQSPTAFTQTVASIEGLLNYPTETYRRTVETAHVEAGHELASLLGCALGASWFLISALRFAKGSDVPLCWTDIYLLPKYAGVTRHPRHESMTVADQVAELFGERPERTQIEVSAGEIPSALAKPLAAKAGSPALTVVRRYTGAGGEPFETTISIHPGQRYSYGFEMRRERTMPKRR